MEVRQGKALFWKTAPHIGPVMVKGLGDAGGVELFDMEKDEFFTVSEAEYTQCNTLTTLDEMLRVTNPTAWESELKMWKRAYQRCGIAQQPT